VSAARAPASGALEAYGRLLGYLRPQGVAIAVAVVAMIVEAGSNAAFVQLIKPMLNDLFIDRDPQVIFWLPIVIIALFAVRGAAVYVGNYGVSRIGRNVVHALRKQVFSRYLDLPAAHFDRQPAGEQIARLTFTVDQVANASTDALKVAILESLTVAGLVAVMLYNSPRLTLALFVLAPLVALVVWFVGRRYRRISHKIQHSVGSVTSIAEEVVAGRREVKIYGGQEYERERFSAVSEHNRRLNLKVASTNALATATVQLIAACALAAVVFIATRPSLIGDMDPGTFMAVITAMMVMLPSLKRLTTVQAHLQRGVAAAQDLFGVLDTSPEVDAGNFDPPAGRGELALRGVGLRYPGQSAAALDGIDIVCAPGTVTALVGRSGSGKTSLASLVARFHEPTSGRILLDGHDLTDYSLAALRRRIAWVGQQVVLFNDTIARNIAYGSLGGASRDAIVAAAGAANAMEFIEALPRGLDSEVGEGGALLSGGQRQRIAIARALLKDAPILFLDEATSALDSESERLIQQALNRVMRNRTVLVIAHRLSTVLHADQIVVLDRGRVVERGTHAELLAAGGHYAALYRMQFEEQDDPSHPPSVSG
jgi:subfamily B ATP-binding cassette protein MsbA